MSDGRREGDDMDSLAWPGFVDILSAVIIMFVFFVMVTATALFFHTKQFKSKIAKESEEKIELIEMQKEKESQTELKTVIDRQQQAIADLKSKIVQKEEATVEIDNLKKELKKLKTHVASTLEKEKTADIQAKQLAAQLSESKDQEFSISEKEMKITIFFGSDAISVTDETKDAVMDFINKLPKDIDLSTLKVAITSGKSPDALTESMTRSIAIARMLNTRNLFIDTKISWKLISVNIKDPEEVEGRYDWVKLEFIQND